MASDQTMGKQKNVTTEIKVKLCSVPGRRERRTFVFPRYDKPHKTLHHCTFTLNKILFNYFTFFFKQNVLVLTAKTNNTLKNYDDE